MGNSEVGHMNLGAGRVIYQMLSRIDKSIRDGDFFENPTLVAAVEAVKSNGGRLHLLGLVSDGGVHASQEHLVALLDLAKRRGLSGDRVQVHAFTDGRDTGPTTGVGFLQALEKAMRERGVGRIATVGGRYHAMDRDQRWDRTKRAWDAIVRREGASAASAVAHVEASYAKGVTDEFVDAAVVSGGAPVADGDAVVYFNFRPDRARQLTRAFAEEGFAGFDAGRRPRVHFATMTRYDETFRLPFAFGDERPTETLGEIVARAGLRQLRVAETEKYAHVTYFFNGGEEKEFPGERRVLVPSPKVATYDLKPEMSASGVADAILAGLEAGDLSLIVANFANCDMVGHSGRFDATVKAVETVDRALGRILPVARAKGWHVFVTADHGNAEEMANPDGSPQTAHTTLPVPLIHAAGAGPGEKLARGILADVAPTMLAAMGLPRPRAMTGRDLAA